MVSKRQKKVGRLCIVRLAVSLKAAMAPEGLAGPCNFVERGLRKALLHAGLCMLSEVMVALTRVQNGCTEALTSYAYLR